jgi:hypothetical protein
MAYIIPSDYLRTIQDANLQQVINSNPVIQDGAELAAQAEAISYLRQKYDVSREFTNTTKWDRTAPYSAADRVYLNAPAYAAANTYNINDLTLVSGQVYSCNTNGTTGTFDPLNWDLVGGQYDIYSALLPFPLFNLERYYSVGDQVYWNGSTYTCLIATPLLDHDTALQYRTYANIPYANIYPDDSRQGVIYWGVGVPYMIAAGTDINNAAFWVSTDTRDQQMVQYFVDITLYHLHSRISPRNIPQLRIDRYNHAIDWLKMCAVGDVTPALPLLSPKQGNRIRWGSNVKNINSY